MKILKAIAVIVSFVAAVAFLVWQIAQHFIRGTW
jgi:hypothetical protein